MSITTRPCSVREAGCGPGHPSASSLGQQEASHLGGRPRADSEGSGAGDEARSPARLVGSSHNQRRSKEKPKVSKPGASDSCPGNSASCGRGRARSENSSHSWPVLLEPTPLCRDTRLAKGSRGAGPPGTDPPGCEVTWYGWYPEKTLAGFQTLPLGLVTRTRKELSGIALCSGTTSPHGEGSAAS